MGTQQQTEHCSFDGTIEPGTALGHNPDKLPGLMGLWNTNHSGTYPTEQRNFEGTEQWYANITSKVQQATSSARGSIRV